MKKLVVFAVSLALLAACYVCPTGIGDSTDPECQGLKLDAGRDGGASDGR